MKKHITFSGSHGTGKSTSAAKEYRDQKIFHPDKSVCLLCDLEAHCPLPINKETTDKAQLWLFSNHIRKEIEARDRFDIVITDRSVVDVIAYTYAAGFEALACSMLGFAEHHVSTYDEITVKQIKHNQYCHSDGIRETDPGFRAQVETILKELYRDLKKAGSIRGSLFYA